MSIEQPGSPPEGSRHSAAAIGQTGGGTWPAAIRGLEDLTLLQLPFLAIAEARRRGPVVTWDLPSGGYAERLTGLVYGATPLGAVGVGHDLVTPDGRRIEVKAIAAGRQTSPAHLDGFDAIVVVKLDPETLAVLWAMELPKEFVEESSRPHKNGGRSLSGTAVLPSWPGGIDLTQAFREAAETAMIAAAAARTMEA